MTRKQRAEIDDHDRLEHMLRAARDAVTIAAGRSRAELDEDITLQHALVHCVEMIGEAAARVSEAGRQRIPELPWSRIVGMRHILIHSYFNVDYDAVWRVAAEHIPELIPLVEQALSVWDENA